MKNILIVTRDFPPYCSKVGWMIRVSYMAKFLLNQDIETHVLACKKTKKYTHLIEIDDAIQKYFIKSYFSYFDTAKQDLNFFQQVIKKLNNLILKFLKNKIIDSNQFDNNKLYKKACWIIEKHNIKNVLISIPPSSYHIIAGRIKSKYGQKINLIVDYRDPWTFREIYVNGRSKKMFSNMRKLEADLIKTNDSTLFASTGMLEIYDKNFKIKNPIFLGNGFIDYGPLGQNKKLEKLRKEMKKENRIIIGFFGSGSGDGSMPHKDFSSLIDIINENESLASKICLLIQGHAPIRHNRNSHFKLIDLPPVSNYEARTNMQYMDLCLHAHSKEFDASIAFQGKVFDYAASQNPIFFMVPNNAKSIYEFKNSTKKHFIANVFDKEIIKKEFEKIIKIWESGKLKEHGFTKNEAAVYTRDKQYEKILDVLK